MSQITEVLEEKPAVLIISQKDHQLVHLLKHYLKKYKADVFISPFLPQNLARFEYIFLLNIDPLPKKNLIPKHKKTTFIFLNKHQQANEAVKYYQDLAVKTVSIAGDRIGENHIDKLLWFAFSQTKESFLQLTALKNNKIIKAPWFNLRFRLPNRKGFILIALIFFLLIHVAFFPPLILSSYLLYQATVVFKQENFSQAEKITNFAGTTFKLSKSLFPLPRSTFLIFSFTLPDDILAVNEKAYLTILKSLKLQQNGQEAIKIILKKDKTAEEKKLLLLRIATIKKDINALEDNIVALEQKIPRSIQLLQNLKDDLARYLELISRFKKILPYSDSLFAKDSDKTYLLLFANNMELRPGGGFIGSFGLLQLKDYSLEKIKIYDVYDADGQLIAHLDPPEAIRKYLGQPHWFLRDSAFSADFLQNYTQAKYFLEKEMNLTNFSGSILITTSAVQNILGAFDDLYLPDFNEKINQKNFYLKTQYHSEKDFFPGSIQKKNFLSSLTQSLLLNLENASYPKFAKELKKSLDEKQIVMYSDDPQTQKVLDSLYWSGRTIKPACVTQVKNCLIDYIFPLDANLGLNKANFFVVRSLDLKVAIDKQGRVQNSFSIQFNNDSSEVYPGGSYRNYFQLLLPRNALLKSISKDGVSLEDYSEEVDQYKKIGFLLEIKPKTLAEIKINYELAENLPKGKSVYQLIVQKQIGAPNSDFVLQLSLASNLHLLNQNFPALVKDKQIIYNTTLSNDKIFLIELVKE